MSSSLRAARSFIKIQAPPSPWKGARVVRHQFSAKKSDDKLIDHYTIDLNISTAFHLETKHGAGYRQTFMAPEALVIRAANETTTLAWRNPIDFITVRLEPWLVRNIAEEHSASGAVELPEKYGEVDPQITYICRALWAEATAGNPSGSLFGESLATALAVRLLKNYSVRSVPSEPQGRLSPRRWKLVRDFVEENLGSDIGLAEMAAVAGLSPYYFSRCFKATIGITPHQYLIERRVAHAKQLLQHSPLSVSQIAAQCGFADQSHLTRHMKRLLGVTPRALGERKNLP